MTDYLRFLFSPADRDRIDPASLVVTETPFDPAPATPDDRWPESLHLRFRITDPAAGAPRLRMIFPGDVMFIPRSPVAAQIIPQPGDVQLDASTRVTAAAFATWSNRGRLRIQALYPPVATDLNRDNKVPGIGAAPTLAWFEPVEMTLDFLNDALLHGLTRRPLGVAIGVVIHGTDPAWPAEAVSRFYRSYYQPPLQPHATDRNQDDVVRFPMPRLVMDAGTGQVEVTITLARRRLSAEESAFPGTNPLGVPNTHPGHPTYDVIPTRLFLQESRSQLIGANAGNPVADAVIGHNTFLTDIKSRLQTLGFGKIGTVNDFDLRTQFAVREFQIYAKMANVATENTAAPGEYALRLNQIANGMVLNGPVTGLLNAMTRQRIEFWLRPANNYRCPVVITARTGPPNYQNLAANGDNIWTYNEIGEGPRVFVRDVSGYYALPADDARDIQVSGQRFIVLGYFESDGLGGPLMQKDGPSGPGHSWQSMALDGLRLTGVSDANMAAQPANAAMWSTYLTLLPTVGGESLLRFDVINANDDQTISIPLFHYALKAGELGGFLAYIRHRDPVLFTQAIEFFGMRPARTWPNTVHVQAKHTSPIQMIRQPGVRFTNLPDDQDYRNYFKSWHWFYRFVMANRIFDAWKLIGYDFARRRIEEIRTMEMTNRPAGNMAVPPQDVAGAPVSVGAVYTSELANGMLLSWHVWRPGHLAAGTTGPPFHASGGLWEALRWAQDPATNGGIIVNWNIPVTAWTNDHEQALIAGIIEQAKHLPNPIDRPKLKKRLKNVKDFTHTSLGHALSKARDSLNFSPPPP